MIRDLLVVEIQSLIVITHYYLHVVTLVLRVCESIHQRTKQKLECASEPRLSKE